MPPAALSETNLFYEPLQTPDPAQRAAPQPLTAPDTAALSQPSRTVVTPEPPRPCEKPATARHNLLSAASNTMPQFLNKYSVPQPPNCASCFGIYQPPPSSSSAPSPLYTSNIPRKAHTQPTNNINCQLTHHLLVDSGTSTHIQEVLTITLKADEKVHLIDIVSALVILENTSDNLPSVICRQKQGFTITFGGNTRFELRHPLQKDARPDTIKR